MGQASRENACERFIEACDWRIPQARALAGEDTTYVYKRAWLGIKSDDSSVVVYHDFETVDGSTMSLIDPDAGCLFDSDQTPADVAETLKEFGYDEQNVKDFLEAVFPDG